MITPNPDTNPELFDIVQEGITKPGDIYKSTRGAWTKTEHPGHPFDWMPSQPYYRNRKPHPFAHVNVPPGYELTPVNEEGKAMYQAGVDFWLLGDGPSLNGPTTLQGAYAPIYPSVRKITTKEKTMQEYQWNPIENGNPVPYCTVIVTLNPRSVNGSASQVSVAYLGDTWRSSGAVTPEPKYWAYLPEEVAPLKESPIEIIADGSRRKVEINAQGDVTVGCTTVPSETMEKIIKLRAKKIK